MNDSLAHHGIKGMQWGVKNGPPYPIDKSSGSNSSSGEKSTRKEKKKEMKKASKNRRILSDNEIRAKIERIKLERQLKTMTDEEIKPGRKFVSDILKQSGKQAATTIVSGAMLYATKAALTKKFDAKDAADYLAPKPKKK